MITTQDALTDVERTKQELACGALLPSGNVYPSEIGESHYHVWVHRAKCFLRHAQGPSEQTFCHFKSAKLVGQKSKVANASGYSRIPVAESGGADR